MYLSISCIFVVANKLTVLLLTYILDYAINLGPIWRHKTRQPVPDLVIDFLDFVMPRGGGRKWVNMHEFSSKSLIFVINH